LIDGTFSFTFSAEYGRIRKAVWITANKKSGEVAQ
jgi:hypothetical protein